MKKGREAEWIGDHLRSLVVVFEVARRAFADVSVCFRATVS
jgi:hypothetical protein